MPDACLSLHLLETLVRGEGAAGTAGSPDSTGAAGLADAHLRNCSHCRTRLAEMREAHAFIAEISRPGRRGLRGAAGVDGSSAAGDAPGERAPSGDPRTAALRDDFPGYAVEAMIDVGGQGAIYRARQLSTGRVVAIKVPVGDAVRPSAGRYRFRREIELTSRLDHPGIVRVFGVCESADGRVGCVMEFVEGLQFDEWAAARRAEGRGSRRRIVAATAAVADAIAYAHQHGVLHRDLKPSNVLVTEESMPRVLDFGLAKALDGGSVSFVTMTGAFLGTLAYAAPEQVEGRRDETDIRTDVYGIGLILYQALAGRVPWDAEAPPPELCMQIRRGEAPRPTPLGGSSDAELDAIVLKAIARDMDRRYASATLLAEDLDRWLSGRPVRARFDSSWYVVRKTAWRNRWWIAAVAAVACMVGMLAALGLKARLAEAIHVARGLESHWSSLADARAVARDDFTTGETQVWTILLNSTEATRQHGIEGVDSLGHAFDVATPGPTGDWSRAVPTSPAYWALTEIYLRAPVVTSLPTLLGEFAAIDPGSGEVLVASDQTVERWDWSSGTMVGQIEIPLPEGVRISGIAASGNWAYIRSSVSILSLVDLTRNRVYALAEKFEIAAISAPFIACYDQARNRHRITTWRLDAGPPQLLWSRDFEFRCHIAAIDAGGQFLAVVSQTGDLRALDAASGEERLRREPKELPHYQWLGSRGRKGELLLWTYGPMATLEWSDAGVSVKEDIHPDALHFRDAHSFVPSATSDAYVVRLVRGGVAIGDVKRSLGTWRAVPTVRIVGTAPSLSADGRDLLVSLGEGNRHAIIDLDSAAITKLAHPCDIAVDETPTIFAVGFAEEGTAVLAASMDGSLRRYRCPPDTGPSGTAEARPTSTDLNPTTAMASGRVLTTVPSGGLTCLVNDGPLSYVGTHELGKGNAKLYRIQDGETELLLSDGRSWYCGIVVDAGRTLWGLGGDGRLFRMNLHSRAIEAERRLSPGGGFNAVARLAHHGLLIAGSRHPELQLLDEVTLEPVGETLAVPAIRDIAVSPTDPDLLVTTHENGSIRVWRVVSDPSPASDSATTARVEEARPLETRAPGRELGAAHSAPDLGGAARTRTTLQLVREMGTHAGPAFCAAFHPSGRILATGGGASETRDIRLWDVEKGRELAALSLFDRGVFSVAFSPDGRWLAAGGEGVPGRFDAGGQLFLIDLTAGERAIAGNLEFHIARMTQQRSGLPPPQAESLRKRFARPQLQE